MARSVLLIPNSALRVEREINKREEEQGERLPELPRVKASAGTYLRRTNRGSTIFNITQKLLSKIHLL